MSVNRCYSGKENGFDVEARSLFSSLHDLLEIKNLTHVRYLCRYDAEGLAPETYEKAKGIVFSEPMADVCYDEDFPRPEGAHTILAVEPLPGQFDQRADSCAQCIQLLTGGERPTVAAAKIYVLEGELTAEDMDKIRGYLINPVDTREASMDKPATLKVEYAIPTSVASVVGFTHMDESALSDLLHHMGLAMDLDDLKFLQTYFRDTEKRDPTITEVRMVDTYWSDHCRHTTFSTHIDRVEILDPAVDSAYRRYLTARAEVYGPEKAAARPQTLMDLATIGAKVLKKRGLLQNLDQSEEINACSIQVPVTIDGPYRNIFHQLTLESQREIFGNRPAGNNVSAQIHGTCRSEVFTHFHLISLVDGRRTGRFRNCQYHGYGVSVKAFVHKKAVIQRSHISRCNAVDCHFGAVGRINILR